MQARTMLVKCRPVGWPKCRPRGPDVWGTNAKEDFARAALPYALLLAQIDHLTHQIEHYDSLVERIAEARYPENGPLRSIPSTGPIAALAFVLILEDRGGFTHSRDVDADLGLRPRQQESGEHDPQLGITIGGNSDLRKLLVQCAHYTLGHFDLDARLRQWGLASVEHDGTNAKRRTTIAVARKLAVLLHRLRETGQTYQPFLAQPQVGYQLGPMRRRT